MIENDTKIKQAEEMILTELKLLLEGTKKGDELEPLAGALAAIFRFTFKQAPMDMLAMAPAGRRNNRQSRTDIRARDAP